MMHHIPFSAPYEFHRSKKKAAALISSTNALHQSREVQANRQKRLNDKITAIWADDLEAVLASTNFNEVA